MKILFLCNIIPPEISLYFGKASVVCGGWISSLIVQLTKQSLKICVVFPYNEDIDKIEVNKNIYYGFSTRYKDPTKYDSVLEKRFENIIRSEKPDIVQIFGTEYPHALAMTKAFKNPERTVCHIQGLVSVYGRHYAEGLPHNVCHISTFRDFLRHDNISQQQKKFYKRGEYEIKALKNIGHIMGRTDWDKACTCLINPNAEYHYVQEIMREPFYEGQWKFKDCEKYTIFMSQGSYPVKGLHYVLEALALIKKRYPQVKLYIGGSSLESPKSLKEKLRESSYSRYINKQIKINHLQDNILFLGNLSAEEMKRQYLNCNVFVSASTIENSPNSVGEALLLGVPVVASDVGGVSSIATHNETAFLYPSDEPYMLAHYVKMIFNNSAIAYKLSKNGKKNAALLYNRENIKKQVMDVYSIMEKK